jgi:outer membrane protein OmpA-like peptidoglycan-associated protein/opacity protein-like surface antigen
MKTKLHTPNFAAFTLALTLLTPSAAWSAEGTTYIGGHFGTNFLTESQAKIDFGSGVVFDGEVDLKSGPEVGIVIGRRYGGWRLEGEIQQGYFKINQAELLGTTINSNAKGDYLTLMANVYRAIELTDKTALFVGAGIGWGRMSYPKVAFDPTCDCFPKAAKGGFAYQFRGGLQRQIGDSAQVFVQYNRLYLPHSSFTGAPSIAYPKRNFGVASLGLLYHFGRTVEAKQSPTPPTPAVEPAPEPAQETPPAAPAPATQPNEPLTFLVLFGTNKAEINSENVGSLENAVTAFTNRQDVKVSLIGGTDTQGSETYNVELSKRRIQAVQNYMLSRGVPSDAIVTRAVGEAQLRIQTVDNVSEPENRRVEIILGGARE